MGRRPALPQPRGTQPSPPNQINNGENKINNDTSEEATPIPALKELSIERSRSGSARSRCSATKTGQVNTVGVDAHRCDLLLETLDGLLKDDAVAVFTSSRHAHQQGLVHHSPGLNSNLIFHRAPVMLG
jgi:hypothetical protein